ncbi:hypothetical protein KIN20_008214 [Parelaphostrongylus tenuis]|uniref:Uncharacterized protein n=1 Tax=Parelaphostrongylus tenuis TaxID=148309 RepID=A0AAD5MNK3_PARTN|nr:hypothetical protein KIN20_008214 [Parelaphostrongylus tenuis]
MNKRPALDLNPSEYSEGSSKPSNAVAFAEQDSSPQAGPVSATSDCREFKASPDSYAGQIEQVSSDWWRSKLRNSGSLWPSWRSSSEEPDSTTLGWKNKLSSMWNSVKYSGTWMHLSDDDYSSQDFK